VALYFAAEAATVLQWNRLSDKIGRKPVLLRGLLGIVFSSILFGLSRSFPALVFRYVRLGSGELFTLTLYVQPLFAWSIWWECWYREEHDGGTH
jgi:MFS family permease